MLYCKTASHWHIKDENRLDDIFISDAISHCKLTCCHCSWLERQSPLPESCRWATTAQSSTGRLLYPLRRDIDFNILYIITPSLLTLLFIAAEIKLDSLDKHTEIFIYISKYLSPRDQCSLPSAAAALSERLGPWCPSSSLSGPPCQRAPLRV